MTAPQYIILYIGLHVINIRKMLTLHNIYLYSVYNVCPFWTSCIFIAYVNIHKVLTLIYI